MGRNLPSLPDTTCGRSRPEANRPKGRWSGGPHTNVRPRSMPGLVSAAGVDVVVWGVSSARRPRLRCVGFPRRLALARDAHVGPGPGAGRTGEPSARLVLSTSGAAAGRYPVDAAWAERAGRIDKVDVDVYRIAGLPPSWESRTMAVALSAGPGALISHRAAAALWGFEGFNRGIPEVTIPRGRKYRRTGVRTHESTDLDRPTPHQRSGIPLTDPSRTLLDLARFIGDRRLLQAVESARRLQLTSWPELIASLAKHARRGRPGIRRLRRVIAANAHRDEITDSDFVPPCSPSSGSNALPEPVLHHQLRGGDGRLHRPRSTWPTRT